eukprot:c25337_g1_i1 orf=788-1162(-)
MRVWPHMLSVQNNDVTVTFIHKSHLLLHYLYAQALMVCSLSVFYCLPPQMSSLHVATNTMRQMFPYMWPHMMTIPSPVPSCSLQHALLHSKHSLPNASKNCSSILPFSLYLITSPALQKFSLSL